eukprot:UN2497
MSAFSLLPCRGSRTSTITRRRAHVLAEGCVSRNYTRPQGGSSGHVLQNSWGNIYSSFCDPLSQVLEHAQDALLECRVLPQVPLRGVLLLPQQGLLLIEELQGGRHAAGPRFPASVQLFWQEEAPVSQ